MKDLGILIDSKLEFNEHVNQISKTAYFKIHQILRVSKTRDLSTLIFLYNTYVRPQLEYASEVWNPSKQNLIQKIEKIQKFFTRIALKKCGLIYRPYTERLTLCKLQKLSKRREITDLTTAFKIIRGMTHLNSSKFFNFSDRSTRRSLLLKFKKHSRKSQNNFFHRTVNNWNKLPNEAMQIMELSHFKEFIKNQ